jgi:hypothetical protein
MNENAQINAMWAALTPEERERQQAIAKDLAETTERERLQREANLSEDAEPEK